MSKELIGKIRDELSDGGVMVAPYWAELLKDSAQTLESQAREIERLRMQLVACGVVALANTPESAARARDMHPDYMSASCGDVIRTVDIQMQLRAELAELKAKPSWVVPEWLTSSRAFADRLYAAGWRDHADAQHAGAAGMYDELIARLNQPASAVWMMPTVKQLEHALESVPSFHELSAELIAPAMLEHLREVISAGEYGDAYQGARQDLLIWKRRALESETKVREQDQVIENLGNALNAESGPIFMGEPVMPASVGDERAAFEAWYLGHFYMGDKQCGLEWLSTELCGGYRHQHPAEQWIVWQARAALSAPSHGEQSGVMFGFDDKSVVVSQEAYQIFMDRERAYREATEASHGEQVREGWKLVPVEATRGIEDAIGRSRNLKASEIWENAIAAAPSAGSHKEQN